MTSQIEFIQSGYVVDINLLFLQNETKNEDLSNEYK
jgi:hypothetical protein